MPTYVGQGNSWRTVRVPYIGQGGTRRSVREIYIGQGGVWRLVHTGSIVSGLQAIEIFTRCPESTDWYITVEHNDGGSIIVERSSSASGPWTFVDSRVVSGAGTYSFEEPATAGATYYFRARESGESDPSKYVVIGPYVPSGC